MAKAPRRPGNLPAEASSFVGRRRQLSELKTKLRSTRILSLVGPGGVGKTRLALRAATDLERGFRDGAWMIELAEVRDPKLVGNVAIAALDLRDQAAADPLAILLTYLRDRELLLVVDNCEHLLEPAATLIAEVIKTAPGVRIIATSREPLSIPGEHIMPVPSLDLPAAHGIEPLHQLRQNEAVMLFSERASAASGTFELTSSNQTAVVDLCRRLDGLPLAIELAAVRTRVLSTEQILDRLADRFSLLKGGARGALPRHQTLRTTIDWSYDLLTAEEQALMRRLCVFAGLFVLEDVEGVSASENVLDLLSSLVEKSLVIKEEMNGVACYHLHETMREYAGLKLKEAGEQEVTEERCTECYISKCSGSAEDARYKHLLQWLAWMDIECDNVRAVLQRCVSQSDPRGIGLASSLGWFWMTRATTEGVRWLDQLLAVKGGNPEARAWGHFTRGFLALLQNDPAVARPELARARGWAQEAGRRRMLGLALTMGGAAEAFAGDHASARDLLDEAELVASDLDDATVTIALLQARSLAGIGRGDLDVVRSASSEGMRLSQRTGDLYSLQMMLMNFGGAAVLAGDLEEAQSRFTESLRVAQQIDDRIAQYYLLEGLGYIAAGSGEAKHAARLLGASETIRIGVGALLPNSSNPELAKAKAAAVAALGPVKFEAEFDAGKRLTRHDALQLALGQAEPNVVPSKRAEAGPLGKRESDVARLVAEGLSNKQIGARLFISERTVDTHVRNILDKLGINSRAQIAAWIATSGPS